MSASETIPSQSNTLIDAGLYMTVVLIWGSTWYAISLQVGMVSPVVSLAYRFAIAAPLMFIWVLRRGQSLRFSGREHLIFAGLGLTLFCCNFVAMYYAALSVTSGLLAVVFSSASIMNIINGALWLKAPAQRRQVLGALLGVAGIGLIFKPEFGADFSAGPVLGGLGLALLGTWFFSMGNMLSAHAQRRKIPVLPATAWGMLYGTGLLILFALVLGHEFSFDPRPGYGLSLIYLAVIGSVAAFSAYLVLLGRIGPAAAAYSTVLFPVVALVISTLFEGYEWSLWAAAGLALVAAGNVIILKR